MSGRALQERRAASQLALRASRAVHPIGYDEPVVVAEWLVASGRLLMGDAEDGVFGNRVACVARAHSAAIISGARCTSAAVVSTWVWPIRSRSTSKSSPAAGSPVPRCDEADAGEHGSPRAGLDGHGTPCTGQAAIARAAQAGAGPRALRSGASAVGRRESPPMQARWFDQSRCWLISTTFPSGSVV